jgi:hypothetical protein
MAEGLDMLGWLRSLGDGPGQAPAPGPTQTEPDPAAAQQRPDLSPQALTILLRRAGWNDEAIQTVLANTTFGYDPGYSPVDRRLRAVTQMPILAEQGPQVSVYGQNGAAAERGTSDQAYAIEHEAHHAYDWDTPSVRAAVDLRKGVLQKAIEALAAGLAQQPQQLPQVYADINALRQHAATSGNRELFDAANQSLWYFHNEPEHLNHQLVLTAQMDQVPDWYRQKYFSYQKDAPKWTGTPANPATVTGGSPRAQGVDAGLDRYPLPAWTTGAPNAAP